ncbi:PAS domain-containing protein [Roseibium salinum]|uniref:PAS domain-containing protein n=1 Tax=Roseibium salinum TaxID=1604349 RepID=UPI003621B6C7
MSSSINLLLRSMRQLVPNPETSAILASVGVSYWAYDPIAEEICWQQLDADSFRGYRVAKLAIKRALDHYAPADRRRFLQVISDAVEHGFSTPARVTMTTELGQRSYDLAAARIIGKTSPLVIGLMKECQPEASASNELPNILQTLSNAFAVTSSAVLVADRNGVVRSANRQFLKLFSISDSKQIVGRDVRTIPNHLGKLVAAIGNLLAGHAVAAGSLKHVRKDGTTAEIVFQINPFAIDLPFGGVIFVGELSSDSLEIDAAEVLDAVPTPILVADLNSRRIKYANKVGRGELGLSATQIGTERLTDKLMSAADVRDLSLVLDNVGWDAGRVWQIESYVGLKRHYRIRSCFIGEAASRQVILEFLPARAGKDTPANEKAQNFFSRLLEMSFR